MRTEIVAEERDEGWIGPGAMAAGWALAGGLAGGLLVAAAAVGGRVDPDALPPVTATLVGLGTALGAVHGAVMGWVGRPVGSDTGLRAELAWGAAGAVLAFLVALVATGWLLLTGSLGRGGVGLAWAGFGFGLVLCLAVCAWAAAQERRALEGARARWPGHNLWSWLAAGTFALLAAAFLALQATAPGEQLGIGVAGAFGLAAAATLWVTVPALDVLRTRRARAA